MQILSAVSRRRPQILSIPPKQAVVVSAHTLPSVMYGVLPEPEYGGWAQILPAPPKQAAVVSVKSIPSILYGGIPEHAFDGWGRIFQIPVRGPRTYWLPNASTCPGKSVLVQQTNSSATYVTIFKSLGGKVNNMAAGTGYTFTTVSQLGSITFTSDGVNWWTSGPTFS